jgi:hypothetical protein
MGILHKLVFILGKLDPNNDRWKEKQIAKAEQIPDVSAREIAVNAIEKDFETNDLDYGRKLYLIENCIYGVDIQPIAIQISKLRFFISLICDQRTNKNKAQNCGVRPLPNLETKFVAANTLISLDRGKGQQLPLTDPRLPKLERELAAVRHKHFAVQRRRDKLALQMRDAELREKVSGVLADGGMSGEASHQLAEWDPYDQNTSAPFFDPEWMYGIMSGFDVVIGNPPYCVIKDRTEKRVYDRIYLHQNYQKDLYLLFFERASRLLKPLGALAYITPNTWLYSLTFRKIRSHMRRSYQWIRVLIPRTRIFAAVVDTVVGIFRFTSQDVSASIVRVDLLTDAGLDGFGLPSTYIPADGSPINVGVPTAFHQLYRKIRDNSVELSSVGNVFNGVKPFEKGKGSPPQDARIMREKPYVVSGVKPSGKEWRPLLRGSLIERYKIRWNNDYWIKYGPWLAAPRDPSIFGAPEKLCVRQTGDSIIATFVSSEFIERDNLHIILPIPESIPLLALLGVLNSKVTGFVYSYMNPEQGEALAQVKKQHVEKLLLPKNLIALSADLECLVGKLLSLKRDDRNPNTLKLDAQIDQLIYKFYDLTLDEIAIVEGQNT